ncbi:type II toxin-antitoxin system HipA family toxin YjjJ [Opitutus sp. ER46]|uniref:type II toxin-antitoxin system HipA family toxin YjjJ n=1 Tax=Opitutus sp. ER46 TaxID=2161864 RepID=UPI000D32400C|nr:type II toxin-antitoxin system HipA family toxin YjjJ [Opitutus sp. ER46]PTX91265.1 type II toxin-antitoxin system HipA family toxinoxin YjjJ [Opitutus sp. ER46]
MARTPTATIELLTLRLQAQGPQTAAELAVALGVDRSQISRLITRAGRTIEQLGGARRARYAVRRTIRATGDSWPLHEVGADGAARELGVLESFYGGWRIRWTRFAPGWSRIVADADGWAEGFPFFLSDLRPQGFVGRAIARRVSAVLSLPEDPTRWSDDEVLVYLQSEGDDLTGNLVVGDQPTRRTLARRMNPPSVTARSEYPALVMAALTGGIPGSSAAGERPKFLTWVADDAGARAVLVKFSPPMDTPAGRRWADLLAAEAIAARVLAEHGESVPGVMCVDLEGRRYLEVPRFDRIGAAGRRGVISLAALQGTEGAIDTTDWVAATEHFRAEDVVTADAATAVRRRRAFGELIGNSDMHPGNLGFYLDDTLPLRLAPAYDMLPMLWAPVAGGEIVARDFAPLPPVARQVGDWSVAAGWAGTFWQEVAGDARISREFAEIAQRAAETVAKLRAEWAV